MTLKSEMAELSWLSSLLIMQHLTPICPCWWQLALSDVGEGAGVLLDGVTHTVSIPSYSWKQRHLKVGHLHLTSVKFERMHVLGFIDDFRFGLLYNGFSWSLDDRRLINGCHFHDCCWRWLHSTLAQHITTQTAQKNHHMWPRELEALSGCTNRLHKGLVEHKKICTAVTYLRFSIQFCFLTARAFESPGSVHA